MQSIELTNMGLTIIYKLSEGLVLENQPSTARRRFLRMLKPHFDDLGLEQMDIIRKYVEKEENGEPKQSKERNFIFSTKENNKLYNEAWDKLNDAKFKIDIMDSNRQDIQDMKKYLTEKIDEIEAKNEGKFVSAVYDSIVDAKEAVEMLNFDNKKEDKEETTATETVRVKSAKK